MTIPVSESELNALQQLVGERYRPLSLLGKKSGRKTLLAEDSETNAKVVIKLLTFGEDFNWDDLKLFEREAETLRSLDHPAIPRYLDYFDVETPRSKGFALVQTYLEARSLEEQVKAGRRFSEEELEQIAQQLLEILEYLHSRQPAVIHRDIKPSNILLTDRTAHSVGQVYLVDFGSVQTLAAREGGTITVVGTYGYMPPEQFGGRAVPASDLYSLGATLIYLASGMHPADLPQDELRLEFEEFVQLSPKIVGCLQALTQPGLGKRFSSAESTVIALKTQAATNTKLQFGLATSNSLNASEIQKSHTTQKLLNDLCSLRPKVSNIEVSQEGDKLVLQILESNITINDSRKISELTAVLSTFGGISFGGCIVLPIFLTLVLAVSTSSPAFFVAALIGVALALILLVYFKFGRFSERRTKVSLWDDGFAVEPSRKPSKYFTSSEIWNMVFDDSSAFEIFAKNQKIRFTGDPQDLSWLITLFHEALGRSR